MFWFHVSLGECNFKFPRDMNKTSQLPSAFIRYPGHSFFQPNGRAWNQRFVDVAMKSSATLQNAKGLTLPPCLRPWPALWLASLLCFQLGEWEMLQQPKGSHILGKIHMEHRAIYVDFWDRTRVWAEPHGRMCWKTLTCCIELQSYTKCCWCLTQLCLRCQFLMRFLINLSNVSSLKNIRRASL